MYECVPVFVCVREAESVCEGKARTGGLDAVLLGSSEGCLHKEDLHQMTFWKCVYRAATELNRGCHQDSPKSMDFCDSP